MTSFAGIRRGGFARGARATRALDLESERTDLAGQELEFRQRQDQATQRRTQITAAEKEISKIIIQAGEAIKAGNKDVAASIFKTAAMAVQEFEQVLGPIPQLTRALQVGAQQLQSILTPEEEAVSTAEAGVAGAGATLGAVEALPEQARRPFLTSQNLDVPAKFENVLNTTTGESSNIDTSRGLPAGHIRVPVSVQAAGLDDITTSTRTASEERIRQSAEVLNSLEILEGQLTGETVGAEGFFRGIANVTLGQVSDEFFSQNRARFENTLRTFREAALRTVSDDTRFNQADRDSIERLFPSDGIFESKRNAEIKIEALRALFVRRFAAAAGDVEAPEPPFTPADIHALVTSEVLSERDGIDILTMLFSPEDIGGSDG